MNRKSLALATITATTGLGLLFAPTTAHATTAHTTTGGVYDRAGVIYTTDGTRLTDDDVNTHPTLSPDHTHIAYVHNDTIWVMNADGTNAHQISDRTATTPTWTTNTTVTYTAESCTGTPGTYRTTLTHDTDTAITPTTCRNQPAPQFGSING